MSEKPDAEELRIRRFLRRVVDGTGDAPETVQPQPDAVTAAAAAAQAHSSAAPHQPARRAGDEAWWDELYADKPAAAAVQPVQEDEVQPDRHERWMRIPPWWSGRHVDITPPADEDGDEPGDGEEEPADEDDVDQEDEQEGDDEDGEEAQPRSRSAQPRKRIRPRSRSRSRGKRSRRRGPGVPQSPLDRPAAPRQSLLDAYAAVPLRIRWLVLHASAAAAGYRMGWVDFATRTAAWIAANGWLTFSAIFWYSLAIGCEFLRHRAQRSRLPIRWLAAVPIASIVTGTLLYGTDWTHLDLEFPL